MALFITAGCTDKKLELSKTYYKEGMSYFNQKEYHQAIDAFKKSSELISSDDPPAYNIIGMAYKELEDYQNAMMWFEKAIESDAQYWISYVYIGDIYVTKENYDKAIEWYTKGKKINPKAEMPYIKLCEIYIKQENIENAISECKEAIKKLAPYDSGVRLKLGDIYAEEKLYDDAMAQWYAAKKDPYYKTFYKEYDPVEERIKNIQSLLEK